MLYSSKMGQECSYHRHPMSSEKRESLEGHVGSGDGSAMCDSTHIPLAISLSRGPTDLRRSQGLMCPSDENKQPFWQMQSTVFTSDIQLGKFRRQKCEAEFQKSEPEKKLKSYHYVNGA